MIQAKEFDDYTIGEMKSILEEVKNNPNGHSYSPELIEKIGSVLDEASKEFEETIAHKVAKGINSAMSKLNSQISFIDNSPYGKLTKRTSFLNSKLEFHDKLKRLFQENPLIKLSRDLDNLSISFTEALGEYHDSFTQLSERGWYVSPQIFDEVSISKIPSYFKPENNSLFEELIVSEVEKNLPTIIENCQVSFEKRSSVFEDIKKLFEDGHYRAVVLMCYTQADGISKDTLGVSFFDKDSGQEYKLRLYLKLKVLEINHSDSIIQQLDIPSNEITAYSKDSMFQDPEKRVKTFNRHLIIHGHSTDYGTKLNAVRAICLLDFLQFIFTEAVEIE